MFKNAFSKLILMLISTVTFGTFPAQAAELAYQDMKMLNPCCNMNISNIMRYESSFARVGHPAPDFKLEAVVATATGQEFKQLKLQDFRGKWLVLFFYPADFTTVCPTEIKGFNESGETFKKLNADILAVSTDSKWSHLSWIKSGELGNIKYPLLSDITKETSRLYGVLDKEAGVALRGLFLIDPQGVIQYQVTHNLDIGRSADETIRVLEALQTGGMCPLGWKPGQKTLQDKNLKKNNK
jgi:alkyl hydroperoxide reductase subunit AhpC